FEGKDRYTDFGWSVGISQDSIVVGDGSAGALHVYKRSGTTWRLEQEFSGPGWSVAISGDRLIAGEAPEPARSIQASDVSVYSRSGTTWSLYVKIDRAPSYQVAMSGDLAVTNATNTGDWFHQDGQANIYVFDGGRWALDQTIQGKRYMSDSEYLGSSVAVSG